MLKCSANHLTPDINKVIRTLFIHPNIFANDVDIIPIRQDANPMGVIRNTGKVIVRLVGIPAIGSRILDIGNLASVAHGIEKLPKL